MNQKLVIGIIALVIIIGGISIYFSNNSKSEMIEKEAMMQKEEAMVAEKDAAMVKPEGSAMEKKEEGAMMVKAGSYEAYSPEKIALAAAKGDVVLFFRALWCPSCRALDADINANLKNIPTNLTILIVDYDNSTDLKKKYGVTYQHTLVHVGGDGTLIKKWSKSPTLVAFIADLNK